MSSTAIVTPSKRATPEIIKLSLCDAYSPKLWVCQTHFWQLQDPQTFQKSLSALTKGLSRTLSEIPALAGTIGRSSEHPLDLIINIDEDAHVELLSEDLTSRQDIPSYDELSKQGFSLTGLAIPFSAPVTLTPVHEGSRMLAAKVNKLKGGVALSFGFNHLLADASTVAEVERIWSLHTADVSAGIAEQSHKSSKNDDDTRIRLSTPAENASTSFDDPHFKIFPTELSQLSLPREPVSAEAALTMLHKAKEAHWASMEGSIDLPKWCIWRFTPENLVKLKQDASSGLETGEWISTMDALIGLFWSRISYLQRSAQKSQDRAELCFPINIRSRLSPPLEAGYVGNAVDIIAADASLSDLEDPSTGWTTAARSVRKAVTGWKQPNWESWLATAKSLPDEQALCPNPLMLLNQRNVAFNDYSKSQSNVLDWGADLGVVKRTRYMKPAGTMKGCATGVVVHPRLPDGGLEVATTSTDGMRELLEKDEVFASYATLSCAFA